MIESCNENSKFKVVLENKYLKNSFKSQLSFDQTIYLSIQHGRMIEFQVFILVAFLLSIFFRQYNQQLKIVVDGLHLFFNVFLCMQTLNSFVDIRI